MYITINNIKGEKRIDLSYSIQNFDSDKEIAVIRMLSDNVKYEILKLRAVMDPISDTKRDKNMGLLVQFLTTFTSHLICTPQL